MKKRIMLIMAVLMLAAPASAEVLITCAVDGNDVTVSYDARSEVELVRAFALDIEVSSEATVTDFAVDSFFDIYYPIYPGSIIIVGSDVNDYGSPICDPCQYPGTLPGINTPGMTVEFGSMYVGDGNAPDPCGVMFTFTVSGDCIVTIAQNVIRAGVVLEDPTLAFDFNSPGITVGCIVPDVVGMTEADANTAIEDAGFVVGVVSEAHDDGVAAGNVISQNPAAGATPGCGEPVDITVSLGPCVVPDVNGMTEADANTAIVAAGFTLGTVTYVDSAAPLGEVVGQNPASGATPGCGTAVDLDVSGDCMKDSAPEYAVWVTWGKPDCWCYQRQCRGDATGTKLGPYWVQAADLTVLKLGWYKIDTLIPAGGICADFNHAALGPYRVQAADLTILKAYWYKIETLVPVCPPERQA